MKYTDAAIEKAFEKAGNQIADANGDIDIIKRNLETLAKEIKLYGGSMRGTGDDGYGGFWPNEGMARDFGMIVAKTCNIQVKDMGTISNEDGGSLVPEEMSKWIIQKLGKYGKFRADAMPVPLGSDTKQIPKVVTDMLVFNPEQGGEIEKADMKFGFVGMGPKKLCCLAVINSELDEDSLVGIGEIVGTSIVRSMAKVEDRIGFLGDSTEEFFGMRGITGSMLDVDDDVANIKGLIVASGNLYSEITLKDFRNVVTSLPDDVDEDAKWYMNKKFYYNVVYELAEAAGITNMFEILSDRKGRHLYGYPVEFVSCMPYVEANNQLCAILADLKSGAFLGQRKTLEIEQSRDFLFSRDQIAIRGIQRLDINAYGVGDTTEAGPIVGLITAAA